MSDNFEGVDTKKTRWKLSFEGMSGNFYPCVRIPTKSVPLKALQTMIPI